MTVKELFQSLEFKEILEPLTKRYTDSLLPLSEYKENYDIICATGFSGKGGTITFMDNGDSDAYMIEGDRDVNIVGMEVVLPESGAASKAEAAAEILWCSAPFGRYPVIDWGDLLEEHEADCYALQAKRIGIKIAIPYCRDKNIRQELISQMQSPAADLCLSVETSRWLISGKGELWGRKRNRSKRKREYRLNTRQDKLTRLSETHKRLDILKSQIGSVPQHLETLILNSSSMETRYYQSITSGKSDRIDYIKDLLLNPLYKSRFKNPPSLNTEYICVLFTSPQSPCSSVELNRLKSVLASHLSDCHWQLFISENENLGNDVKLDITAVTFSSAKL